jgi:hypothetical protein
VKLGAYIIWAASAIGAGVVVLLGYFLEFDRILRLRLELMRWAVLLAAVALLLGLWNLFSVHWNKLSEQAEGWPYSAVLILAFLLTLAMGLAFGPDNPMVMLLFRSVQVPVEASLMALLAVSLTFAGFRLISRRRDVVSVVFVGTALLIVMGSAPWLIGSEGELHLLMGQVRNWLAQVWAAGGARGILMGVALGAVVTGLRVLLAADRPYGE